MIQGTAWTYGDNVDTDAIYPSKYLVTFEKSQVAQHVMEGIDPEFVRKVKPGDIVVAGSNFGCGSAREQAATALSYAGVSAVLAVSFSRTLFRNAINIGLPVLTMPESAREIRAGDRICIDVRSGRVEDLTQGKTWPTEPLPEFIMNILEKGGAIPYYKARASQSPKQAADSGR